MSFAAARRTASRRQLAKIKGLAAAIGEGETLVLALARDVRVASMRTSPNLLGHPVTDDLAELSMFEASSIIDTLAQACAERDREPSFAPKVAEPKVGEVITMADLLAERGRRAPDGDPLGAELSVWGL